MSPLSPLSPEKLIGLRIGALASIDTIPLSAWRHHGIGCLQAYIREHAEPEVRIHIWHPDLVKPGIRDAGAVHNHRFDLISTVLHGQIINRRYTLYADTNPLVDVHSTDNRRWRRWAVENARSAGVEHNFDGAHKMEDALYAVRISESRLIAGELYRVWRGDYHESVVDDIAVTVCSLHEKHGQAHLLVPDGHEPIHAFGPQDKDLIGRLVDDARQALAAVFET